MVPGAALLKVMEKPMGTTDELLYVLMKDCWWLITKEK